MNTDFDQNISHAHIEWRDGQPYSTQFADVFFSSSSGLQETQYVFLQHNQLAERWRAPDLQQFTIAETGFGTGLNFLCAWQLWDSLAQADARLHFISTELYPLQAQDLAQALALWPELSTYSDALLAQYRFICPGWHRLVFAGGRVTLSLLVGDANHTLPTLDASVDAWFLDGFAPAKNNSMWQDSIFQHMARLSHSHTTFATFTSAGQVRRGLQAAGFAVNKAKGFGRKREMQYGHYAGLAPKANIRKPQQAIVIGGGIAGAATSAALAQRGIAVTLLEQRDALAQAGSGNPLAMLYPRLGDMHSHLNRFALHSYLCSLRLLLQSPTTDFNACGLLQLAFNAREQAKMTNLAKLGLPDDILQLVDAAQATQIAGIAVPQPAFYFPHAGYLKPSTWCEQLTQNVQVQYHQQALRLVQNQDIWQVWQNDKLLAEAEVLVVANAQQLQQFSQLTHCTIKAVRGQISQVQANSHSTQLNTVLCTEGYISPAVDGLHCLGASYSEQVEDLSLSQQDHRSNLQLAQYLGLDLHMADIASGRVAVRCTTSDYLPLAGQLLDSASLQAQPPRPSSNPQQLPWLNGLYVNAGHGSKGMMYAPMCAEIIASAICGEPSPVDNMLLGALNPNRFLLRKMGLKKLAASSGFAAA